MHITQIFRGLDRTSYVHHLATNISDSDHAYRAAPLHLHEVTSIPIVHRSPLSDLGNIWNVYSILSRRHFDIVHGHGAKGGLYARLLGRITGAKVVYTPHGGHSHDQTTGLTKRVHITSEAILAKWTDAYVFESHYAQNQFLKKIGLRDGTFWVNYNGISTGRSTPDFSTSRQNGEFVIGAFGRLEHAKGFDLLIKATKILTEAGFSDVKCRIFGEGEYFDNLNLLITRLNLSEHVRLMGYSHQVSNDMTACNIIVHPSRFDSMPYVPLEAMRAGKAVVATKVGGLPELISDQQNGLLAEPDATDIAAKIRTLMLSQPTRLRLARNGFTTIGRDFSAGGMLARLDSIYRYLVS
jgi:glycosyltransferase involved in cell wall biosynthesis